MLPSNSFSGNICFEFSVLVLYSVIIQSLHAKNVFESPEPIFFDDFMAIFFSQVYPGYFGQTPGYPRVAHFPIFRRFCQYSLRYPRVMVFSISFASLIQRNVPAASTSPEPERFFGRRQNFVPKLPLPTPNTKQKASLILSQRRPDGLVPRLVQVPYLYLVTVSKMDGTIFRMKHKCWVHQKYIRYI